MNKNFMNTLKDRAPVIFAGLSIASAAVCVIAAVKTAPKAKLKIEDAKRDKEEKIRMELPEEQRSADIKCRLTPIEKGKIIFKCCWIAILAGAAAIGSTVMSQYCAGKQIQIARASAELSAKALSDYVAASAKALTPKQKTEIKNSMAKNALEKNPPKKDANGSIIAYGHGDILVYDPLMNVYIWTTVNKVESARNVVNAQITQGEFVTIREFYDEFAEDVKLPSTADELGFGAGFDEMPKNGFLEIVWDSKLNKDEGELYAVILYTCKDRKTMKEYHAEEEE